MGEEVQGARISRSRPYHKNDNRFVEQKNFTLIFLPKAAPDTTENVHRTLRAHGLEEGGDTLFGFPLDRTTDHF